MSIPSPSVSPRLAHPLTPPVVRTKFEQDRKPLPAKSLSISVRCYEVSRSRGAVLLVDHTHVLWQKPPASDYADLAEVEFPFKFTFPEHTAGPSTANFQVYRTFWRVEASEFSRIHLSSAPY